MQVDFNGMRKNLLNEMFEVMDNIKPLVKSYRNGDYNPKMERFEASELFDSINELRSSVGLIMCVYDKESGILDLSELAHNLEFINYKNEEEDDEKHI